MNIVNSGIKTNNVEKTGLILFNMGGPSDLESIPGFLFNLFSDPELINLPRIMKPFQGLLARILSRFRSKSTKKMYQSIGNGSPILQITEEYGSMLEKELHTNGIETKSIISMRYTEPNASIAVEKLEAENVSRIILFTQYPHYAKSTTGSSFNEFYKYFNKSKLVNNVDVIEIDNWGEEEGYIDWWVKKIKEAISDNNIALSKDIHVIFSSHGLPMKYIKNGEKYTERIENSVNKVIKKLGDIGQKITHHISYQSRAGPFAWTQPYTNELIGDIAKFNPALVILVPFGFVTDHVEILYEIDIKFKKIAEENGISNFTRVEVPNSDPEYVKNTANMIIRKLGEANK